MSVVIRTLNEAEHLDALLTAVDEQIYDGGDIQTVVVDSGSTDGTLDIAAAHRVTLTHIRKEDFSFGRSLNIGCAAATGDVLVFVSGHCIPVGRDWIAKLVAPLAQEKIAYSYGGQIGIDRTRFSEIQIFAKYFPAKSSIPQEGFFCNNANAALRTREWLSAPFDEELTGLEDMHLAKRLVEQGLQIAYVADAPVHHIHNERWSQIRRRFEREAIALQKIMPEVHLSPVDVVRYAISAILLDMRAALHKGQLLARAREIVLYRVMQFWGSYRGNHDHRTMSRRRKETYFYPR